MTEIEARKRERIFRCALERIRDYPNPDGLISKLLAEDRVRGMKEIAKYALFDVPESQYTK